MPDFQHNDFKPFKAFCKYMRHIVRIKKTFKIKNSRTAPHARSELKFSTVKNAILIALWGNLRVARRE
jgi:hypothetical protein